MTFIKRLFHVYTVPYVTFLDDFGKKFSLMEGFHVLYGIGKCYFCIL